MSRRHASSTWVALAAASSLFALAACGGGSLTSQLPESTTEPVATDGAPTTTDRSDRSDTSAAPTTSTSTTSSTSTTTLAPMPWLDLPDPGFVEPELAPFVGGPRAVATVSVSYDLEGFAGDSRAPGNLAWTFEQMGLRVVEGDADVSWRIEASGRRTSASYTRDGVPFTCWAGYQASGEITLVGAESGEFGSWPFSVEQSPPQRISTCPKKDASLVDKLWVQPMTEALTQTFGVTAAVLTYARFYPVWSNGEGRKSLLDVRPGTARALTAALHDDEADVREGAMLVMSALVGTLSRQGTDIPDELWDVVPHVIRLGALTDFTGTEGGSKVKALLREFFFGEATPPRSLDQEDPAAWWALWEDRR